MATSVLDDGDAGTIIGGGRDCKGAKSHGREVRRRPLPNEELPKIRSSPHAIQIRFIALLKPPFKFSDDYRRAGWGKAGEHVTADWQEQGQTGVCDGSV
jgi:hypothetical protein